MGKSIHINFEIDKKIFFIALGIIILIVGLIIADYSDKENRIITKKINSNNLNPEELKENSNSQETIFQEDFIKEDFLSNSKETDKIVAYIDSDVIEFERIIIKCLEYTSPYEIREQGFFLGDDSIDYDNYRRELKDYVSNNLNLEDEDKINCLRIG